MRRAELSELEAIETKLFTEDYSFGSVDNSEAVEVVCSMRPIGIAEAG